jgi:hypothetical protein
MLGILAFTAACRRTDVYAVTADSGREWHGGRTAVPSQTDGAGGSSGAVPSAGCGKTSTITFGAIPNQDPNAAPGSGYTVGHGDGGYVTIQSSGKTRTFTMRLPDNYDPNHPYWLSFTFHTGGGNAYGIDNGGSNGYVMAYYGLQKLSNNGAIFVAPDGLGGGWANSNGEDLQLVDDMVKLIEDNYCVDTTHIFAQGVALGGGMTYEIACARASVFRGVAIYEGAVFSGCDNGNDPIAYWQMVGLTDGTFTIDKARPMRDQFAKNNGCTIPQHRAAPATSASPLFEPRRDMSALTTPDAQAGIPCVGAYTSQVSATPSWMEPRTYTIPVRQLPRPARPPALVPGSRKTCGRG